MDWVTRAGLRLWQIGPEDLDAEARKQQRKRRDRERKGDVRRGQGRKPRAEYEGKSLSRLKPWEAEGISRASWYRRQNREPVAQVCPQTNGSMRQVCPQSTFLNSVDTPVSRHEGGSGKHRGDVSSVHNTESGRRR